METFSQLKWDRPTEGSLHFFSRDDFAKCSQVFVKLHQSRAGSKNIDGQGAGSNESRRSAESLKRELISGQGGVGQVIKVENPAPFPRVSVLGKDEQWDYMFFLTRFMKDVRLSQNDPVALQQFMGYQTKLREEYEEFQKFAREVFTTKVSTKVSMTSEISHYVIEAWKSRMSRVHDYPRNYKETAAIVLIPKEASKILELKLDKTLLEMGRIPRQVHLPVNTPAKLPRSYKKVVQRFPTNRKPDNNKLSQDPNVEQLSFKYQADFVLPSSVLKTVVANLPPFLDCEWDIPFVVRDQTIAEEVHRVICMDKPLPRKRLITAEKQKWFAKFSAKVLLTQPGHPKCYQYPGSTKQRRAAIPPCPAADPSLEIFNKPGNAANTLETFGVDPVDANPNTASPETKKNPAGSENSSDSDSESGLVIDAEPGDTSKTKSAEKTEVPSPLDDIIKEQDRLLQGSKRKMNVPVDQVKEDPAKFVPPERGQNVTYRLWTLRTDQRQLRIIIRTRVDAAIVAEDKKLRTFKVFPKLEFQPWYGLEQQSPRDTALEWISAYVRPESRILRARVDAYTGDVIMTEQKDAFFLEAEARFRQGPTYSAAQHLSPLWAVLSQLEDLKPSLKPGSYLLQHRPSDGVSVHVLQAEETAEDGFDLYETYDQLDMDGDGEGSQDLPFSYLNPWIVTPTQRAIGRPPVTFEPQGGECARPRGPLKRKTAAAKKKNAKKKLKTQKKDAN